MNESAGALSAAYGMPLPDLLANVDNLIVRFGNAALGDSCVRVGSDTARKLGPADRFLGALALCARHEVRSDFIALGAACALRLYMEALGSDLSSAAAERELETLARGENSSAASIGSFDGNNGVFVKCAVQAIMDKYVLFDQDADLDRLANAALMDAASAPIV
jgi:mannitol-1-phosphate/altronate dehydrogenase